MTSSPRGSPFTCGRRKAADDLPPRVPRSGGMSEWLRRRSIQARQRRPAAAGPLQPVAETWRRLGETGIGQFRWRGRLAQNQVAIMVRFAHGKRRLGVVCHRLAARARRSDSSILTYRRSKRAPTDSATARMANRSSADQQPKSRMTEEPLSKTWCATRIMRPSRMSLRPFASLSPKREAIHSSGVSRRIPHSSAIGAPASSCPHRAGLR